MKQKLWLSPKCHHNGCKKKIKGEWHYQMVVVGGKSVALTWLTAEKLNELEKDGVITSVEMKQKTIKQLIHKYPLRDYNLFKELFYKSLQEKKYNLCYKLLYFYTFQNTRTTITNKIMRIWIIRLIKGPPRIGFDWILYSIFKQRKFNNYFSYKLGEVYIKNSQNNNCSENTISQIEYPFRKAISQMNLKEILTDMLQHKRFWKNLEVIEEKYQHEEEMRHKKTLNPNTQQRMLDNFFFEQLQKKDYFTCLKIWLFWFLFIQVKYPFSYHITRIIEGPPRIGFDWLNYSVLQQRKFNNHFYYKLGELHLKNHPDYEDSGTPIREIEYPVREAIIQMHLKGIWTNMSEGGGGFWHGDPELVYIDTYLDRKNFQSMQDNKFILESTLPTNKSKIKKPVFWKERKNVARRYVRIGFSREGMNTKQVITKTKELTDLLQAQN